MEPAASSIKDPCDIWYHIVMKAFFRGWRRKTGMVMLGLACCITAAWLRSCFREDSFRMTACGRRNLIISSSSRLCWWSWNEPSQGPRLAIWITGGLTPEGHFDQTLRKGPDLCPHLDLHFVQMFTNTDVRRHCTVRYWVVVLSLTLLAACLILWTPRKKSPSVYVDSAIR